MRVLRHLLKSHHLLNRPASGVHRHGCSKRQRLERHLHDAPSSGRHASRLLRRALPKYRLLLFPLRPGSSSSTPYYEKPTVTLINLFFQGLAMLTFSAVSPSLRPQECRTNGYLKSCPPSQLQSGFFFFSLYLVAIAMGGHKPCVQAFGADQFDENDPEESKSRSSFFNWWYFGMNGGMVFTYLFVNYVQDEVGWGLGFGLPCIFMAIAMVVFLLGSKTYRYCIPASIKGDTEENDALLYSTDSTLSTNEPLSGIIRLFPIWVSCLMYAVVFAQSSTFFTKQGSTMDRRIGSNFLIPPAALQSFISISVVVFIPIYDQVVVPLARSFTGKPSGITMLQRIGIGIILSIVSVIVAALVETKRLQTAKEFDLVDLPGAIVPMSLWWLVPQYVLYGASDVFAMVGLQEFFYDQVPDGMRSLGLALYLSIFGIGSFISSFLVSVIDRVSRNAGESWFSNNLNRGHLDYFYWLIASLSSVAMVFFVYFSRSFHYKSKVKATTV